MSMVGRTLRLDLLLTCNGPRHLVRGHRVERAPAEHGGGRGGHARVLGDLDVSKGTGGALEKKESNH